MLEYSRMDTMFSALRLCTDLYYRLIVAGFRAEELARKGLVLGT